MNAELSKAAADRADVARIRAGDVEAFGAIVRRWQTALINLAYRFCGDRGRAEEMAQEAFCGRIEGSKVTVATRRFPPGYSRWRRTCTARSFAVSRRERSRSRTPRSHAIRSPRATRMSCVSAMLRFAELCWPCRRNIARPYCSSIFMRWMCQRQRGACGCRKEH